MRPAPSKLLKLSLTAAANFGVFTTVVANGFGFTRHELDGLIRRGVIERLSRRAYRFVAAPNTWNHRVAAACAALGPEAVAAYLSAVAIHRVQGYASEPDPIEILVPREYRSRVVTIAGVVVRSTDRLRPQDRVIVRSLPVASAEWTLARLGWIATRERVEEALDKAEHEQRVSRGSVTATLSGVRGRGVAGVVRLSNVLEFREEVGKTPNGVLGRRIKRILVANGLPVPELEYPVLKPDGTIGYFDVAYPWALIGIEGDDAGSHVGVVQRGNDLKRQNLIELADFRVFRFTFEQVRYDPSYLVDIVRRALAQRGHPAA
jgi:hypothetical protein